MKPSPKPGSSHYVSGEKKEAANAGALTTPGLTSEQTGIALAPPRIREAYRLMCERLSTREMAERMGIQMCTAATYRNRVNLVVGFRRPWEK